jgi:RNA polymerase sigma-70 factor (ECF subfamily)
VVVGIVNIARRRSEREGRVVPWTGEEDESDPSVDPRRFRPSGEQWASGWTEQGEPSRE